MSVGDWMNAGGAASSMVIVDDVITQFPHVSHPVNATVVTEH